MVIASQLRPGMAIQYQGQDYKVIAADYHPGQGRMGGATHARLESLSTGTLWEYSFRSDLRLDTIAIERQTLEFLYTDGDQCVFMNPSSYEQIEVAKGMIGPQAEFLEPGMRLGVEFVGGSPIGVLFPDYLEIRIADTAPPARQQAESTFKPARFDNGVEVMVPQFVKTGDVIRLDLRTMKYMDRVKSEAKAKGA